MKKIYLIGGGEIANKETLSIDKEFLLAAGGENARLLFFPTAAFDNDGYIKGFTDYFTSLGCKNIESVKLSCESRDTVKNKIKNSSGIYLGGGSTAELIRAFKASDIVGNFIKAIDSGTILAGISAGCMCLGNNSVLSENDEDLEIGEGLGALPNVIPIAHYSLEYEKKYLAIKDKFKNCHLLGIPEKSAFVINGDKKSSINKVYEY